MSRTLDVWAPLPVTAHFAPRQELPFPLEQPGCRLFAKARHGLFRGAQHLGLGPGDEVLMPAFNHGSEVEALQATGAECRFFDTSPDLRDAPEAAADLVGPATKAIHLIHYLGLPQDAVAWRRFCDEHGLLLLEDAAQAWLARGGDAPVGSHGDLAVFCLYKTLGLPDGAALLMDEPPDGVNGSPGGRAGVARRHAAWVASGLPGGPSAPGAYDPERDFALGDPALAPSAGTALLVAKLADRGIPARRRGNYRMLRDLLGERVEAVVDEPPPGSSPLVLPVLAEDKPALLERLRAVGVRGLNLWSARHPSIDEGAFPEAQRLRDRVVGLPVHQSLTPEQVRRVARGVVGAPRRAGARVVDVEDIDAFADEWNDLAERSGSFFGSHVWAATWWEHFGREDARLRVRAVYDADGGLRAVLPLYLWRTRPGVLRVLGHGIGADVAPVCAPGDRPLAARALRAAVRREGASMLVADALPADAGWISLIGARAVHHHASPVIAIDGASWDDYLATRSSNFRGQVRRRERKLAKAHELSYRATTTAEELERDFAALVELHGERWGDESGVYSASRLPFHRAIVNRALAKGWLRMWTLDLDGEPAAAWYGFRLGDTEAYYQAGRAERHEHLSVGFVLLAHTIREAMNDGMRTYRLGPGDAGYKYRFATSDEGADLALLGGDGLGAAAVLAALGAERAAPLRRAARSLVAR